MFLSFDWLKQYMDMGDITPEEAAYRLTMATAEVEGVETLTRTVKGVLVAEITAVEPLETGDSEKVMNYVTVDTGGETVRTVCGAPNVRVGLKTVFAAPGTTIGDGTVVREQEIYGRKSCGILCSPLELGWGESHAGIVTLPDSMPLGAELAEFVPETDYVIEVDNKSITHRPDLWGHYGFARELAAIFRKDLRPLALADAADWEDREAIPLRIEDYDGCPGYCCLDIDELSPAFSPLEIQYRLLAVGLRPINLLVDLTNYIMCELGQPMHAFDGERVRDIIVAPFGRKGTFVTLDSVERPMLPEDLMIKDHTGPIALAGIMGGEDTEIRDETGRVLLESANFNPARIRRTAMRLGLRSDASLRFEKGQPPYHMGVSIRRFVRMLIDSGQKPVIRSRLTCDGDTGEEARIVTMKPGYISQVIGMEIPRGRIVEILESLDFGCSVEGDELRVTIPRHRSARDISIPHDIVEEVARIYGYDNITPAMPEMELRGYSFNAELQKQHKVRRYLSIAKKFHEAYTYSWYDDVWLKRIGYDPGETLTLVNPSSENNTRMRRDLIPNLLALIEPNSTHRDAYFMYELGHVFQPEGKGCRQTVSLAGVGYRTRKLGSLEDLFLAVKGVMEEIFVVVNVNTPVFTVSQETSKPWCSPGSCMDISLDGETIGQLGFLTGKTFEAFEKDDQVVWFELNLDKMKGTAFPEVTYEPIPVFPGSWMDFSIVDDSSRSFADLSGVLDGFSHPILKRRKFLYSYKGKGLPGGKISYTFRFWLGLRERTLTGEDLSDFRSRFLAYLESKHLTLR